MNGRRPGGAIRAWIITPSARSDSKTGVGEWRGAILRPPGHLRGWISLYPSCEVIPIFSRAGRHRSRSVASSLGCHHVRADCAPAPRRLACARRRGVRRGSSVAAPARPRLRDFAQSLHSLVYPHFPGDSPYLSRCWSAAEDDGPVPLSHTHDNLPRRNVRI